MFGKGGGLANFFFEVKILKSEGREITKYTQLKKDLAKFWYLTSLRLQYSKIIEF